MTTNLESPYKWNSKEDAELAANLNQSREILAAQLKETRTGTKKAQKIESDIAFCNAQTPLMGFDEQAAVNRLLHELGGVKEAMREMRKKFIAQMIEREYRLSGTDSLGWNGEDLVKAEFNADQVESILNKANLNAAPGGDPIYTLASLKEAFDDVDKQATSGLLRDRWSGNGGGFYSAVQAATRAAASEWLQGSFGRYLLARMLENKAIMPAWTGWVETETTTEGK